MMSQPASACTSGLAHQHLERFVVDDRRRRAAGRRGRGWCRGRAPRRAMHADIGTAALRSRGCAADEVVRIEGFAPVLGAQLRVGVGKERDGRDAEGRGLLGGRDGEVDGQALDAGHRGDTAPACHAPSMMKIGQIRSLGGERVLGHQSSRPWRAPVAAHAHRREGARRGAFRRRLGGTRGCGLQGLDGCRLRGAFSWRRLALRKRLHGMILARSLRVGRAVAPAAYLVVRPEPQGKGDGRRSGTSSHRLWHRRIRRLNRTGVKALLTARPAAWPIRPPGAHGRIFSASSRMFYRAGQTGA